MLETVLNMNYDVMLSDLNYDSLDIAGLCIEIEESYHVTVTADEMMSFKSCGDVQKYIKSQKLKL